jgi:glycosyltransferase involved in cell wall biosynthesis
MKNFSEKPVGVSIICCTYNGVRRLPKTFEAIKKQDFLGDWEFILVDNASDDGTSEYAQSFFSDSGLRYQIIQCHKAGKNFALWQAFESVNFSYILICDDDNELFPDYLTLGLEILENNHKIGALGGKGMAPKELELPEWFEWYQLTYAIGPQSAENGPINKGWGLYGAGCFFRFKAVQELLKRNYTTVLTSRKGNTFAAGGDTEMCLAVECLGYEVWYHEQLRFYHHIEQRRLDWDYFLRLKASIASNFPLMEPYRYFILNESSGYDLFVFKKVPGLFWNFFFIQALYIFRPKLKNKVFRKVYTNTLKGLFKNFLLSRKAHQKVKSILQ